MAISDYSTTAASNISISGIDISGTTGKVKDGDNAIRQMMADIKAGVDSVASFSGLLYGLTLSNNASDATNDIDVAVGVAIDGANAAFMTLGSSITKRLDASWAVGTNQGGLDTGSAANQTYHVWLIKRVDTGVVDVLFSGSASSPTMPTNYTLKRRIGSIVRSGGSILGFKQDGDDFRWSAAQTDVNTTNPGTSAVTPALTLPSNIRVRANVTFQLSTTTTSFASHGLLTDTSITDTTPTSTKNHLFLQTLSTAGTYVVNATADIWADTSRQIRYRVSNSDASTVARIYTHGWKDSRGRLS